MTPQTAADPHATTTETLADLSPFVVAACNKARDAAAHKLDDANDKLADATVQADYARADYDTACRVARTLNAALAPS